MNQNHKHLKEMQKITGLSKTPLFSPLICDYYSGMVVTLQFYTDLLKDKPAPGKVHAMFTKYYEGEQFVKVMPFGKETDYNVFLAVNACSGWDGIEIYVTGNEDRLLVSTRFDNLGKGASGAAVQCLNIILGCDESKGLVV
ncbi:MAG: hypothetical protein K2G55_15060 [Lachnospiraceae bacterium]|nr:hypothetical protein [Lachnospiraceae bacterium]